MNYKQREIVFLPFPFSDLSTTKKRPVLVLSNNFYNEQFEDILVCVVSSNQFADSYSVELRNEDLIEGRLPNNAVIIIRKLFTIHQSAVIRKFSTIGKEKFQEVTEQIIKLLKEENPLE